MAALYGDGCNHYNTAADAIRKWTVVNDVFWQAAGRIHGCIQFGGNVSKSLPYKPPGWSENLLFHNCFSC